MRKSAFILLHFFSLTIQCQITQLPTGTTVVLKHLSCIGNTVLVGGLSGNYLAKSYNEGKTLIPLTSPGPTLNNALIQRIGKDTVYLLSIGNNAALYRSTDGGDNWAKRMDTTIFVPNTFAFFNGNEGMADYGYGNQILRTLNGGAAWTLTTTPMLAIIMFKTYGDSMIIIGGSAPPNTGGDFLISKNRGHTWPYPTGLMKNTPTDFCFLNSDTIFGISNRMIWGSTFTRSMDGGQNWQIFPEPLYYNDGMAKKGKEIYVVGADDQNVGVISKSTDFGQSWSMFNTGINCRLINLVFLNDSSALLSGTNGVLLRWNYTKTVFTGIKGNNLKELPINVFPNPVNDRLFINSTENKILEVTLSNIIGQVVYTTVYDQSNIEMDLKTFPSGVYFIKIKSENKSRVVKIIKQ